MSYSVGNWVGETSDTVGTGDIHLIGALDGYTTFSSIGETQFWYAIVDGDNREAGVGTLSGDYLIRDRIYSILQNGNYFINPSPLPLSGGALIFSTFNKTAFDMLLDHLDDPNAHSVFTGPGVPDGFVPDPLSVEHRALSDSGAWRRATKVFFQNLQPTNEESAAGDLWLVTSI